MGTEPGYDGLRYEIKMVAQASGYSRLRGHLRLDVAGVRVLYPERVVQSIYLDTLGHRALQENLAGISRRSKLRFRWYGDTTERATGTLERKVRRNALGYKDTLAIDEEIQLEGADAREFVTALRSAITGATGGEGWDELTLDELRPVQWIRYRREYYATADGRVRITIDRELRTYDQRLRGRLTARFPTPLPDVMIVEAKCAAEDHDRAQELLNRMPLFVDKCSKFVLASYPGRGADVSVTER